MDKLILENVRCFQGHHELPLAPLTILIGENSTGKSTVLAAAKMAKKICEDMVTPNFNEDPFDWGAYDQIVYTRANQGRQIKSFSIGYEFNTEDDRNVVQITSTFTERIAQPRISKWTIGTKNSSIIIEQMEREIVVTGSVGKERKLCRYPLKDIRDAFTIFLGKAQVSKDRIDKELFESFLFTRSDPFECSYCSYAFAPIRTRPRRTYDRRADTPNPEGEHVPMVLARLKTASPKKWTELKTALTEFGRECGLFKSVNIKSYDKKSGPFQVQITVNGSPTNLIDVGYGVSQALPLLVDCLEESNRLLLMQQPEVHLHPRAQAQLGSFFGYLVRKQKKQFIVETHSDYLVDRIRMDVRDGKHGLRPEDVQILYFERKDAAVSVHPMQIDESGNLLDAPPSYRRFFLDEEKRFLGG